MEKKWIGQKEREVIEREREKEVWWRQLWRPAARSAPSLAPSPPHRLGVRVWAFLCSAVSQLFVTVSDLMLRWINHTEALWVVCTVYMCLCVSEHTWIYVHGGAKQRKEAWGHAKHILHLPQTGQRTVFWVGWFSLLQTESVFFYFFFITLSNGHDHYSAPTLPIPLLIWPGIN